jgi:hypothetical protein
MGRDAGSCAAGLTPSESRVTVLRSPPQCSVVDSMLLGWRHGWFTHMQRRNDRILQRTAHGTMSRCSFVSLHSPPCSSTNVAA